MGSSCPNSQSGNCPDWQAHKKMTLKQNGITRFFVKSGDNLPYLLLHAMGDTKAKQTGKTSQAFIPFIRDMMHYFFDHFKPRSEKPRLITGDDLIQVFSLTPSPLFKTILNKVEEARLADRIHNRSQALNLVRAFLNNKT
jgi:poly(A) polymerase